MFTVVGEITYAEEAERLRGEISQLDEAIKHFEKTHPEVVSMHEQLRAYNGLLTGLAKKKEMLSDYERLARRAGELVES